MINPKDVLVVTTNSFDNIKIESYLKPLSSHLVAGTNLFSDIFAEFSDIFGGRSGSYRKQLESLYIESVEKLKVSAAEIGANCVIGLSIDIDEVSGKGKSMFMITAIGTAVILENSDVKKVKVSLEEEKGTPISADRFNLMMRKRAVINKFNADELELSSETWNFITENRISEVYPYLLKKFSSSIKNDNIASQYFKDQLVNYIDSFTPDEKATMLYGQLLHQDSSVTLLLVEMIKKLKLFEYERVLDILKNKELDIQKRGLRLAICESLVYEKEDISKFRNLKNYILENFQERGQRVFKKNMVTFKEKEKWECECGKVNDLGVTCHGCSKDIFGFTEYETHPTNVVRVLDEKVSLLQEHFD